jgi:hypothetical protein
MGNTTNKDTGRGLGGIVLIGIGLLFLLGQVFNVSILGTLWPFFIIGPGAAFLYFAQKDKKASGLAVPGSMITGTGLILLYQSLTGHWASWAYIWALYPVFLGLALRFMGRQTGDTQMARNGDGFVTWGGLAFIVMAALFELLIFNAGGIFGSLLLPLVLIVGGVWLLRPGRTRSTSKEKAKVSAERIMDEKPKSRPLTPSERLRVEIDAALAEDDHVVIARPIPDNEQDEE